MARAATRSRTKAAATKTHAAVVIAAALAASWDRVEGELERYRREPKDAGTHDLRVGLRRLLAATELARALEPEGLPEKLVSRAKHLLSALSPLRDIEIQREAVDQSGLDEPARQTLLAWLEKRERKLGKKIHRRITRFPTEEMRLGMLSAVALLEQRAHDPSRSAELVILGKVGEAYAAFDRRRRAAQEADLEVLHRVRIAFKKFRYAVELGGPLLRTPPQQQKDALKRFQDELGALQDSVVVLELFDRRAVTREVAGALRIEQGRLATQVRELLAAQIAGATPEFSEYLA